MAALPKGACASCNRVAPCQWEVPGIRASHGVPVCLALACAASSATVPAGNKTRRHQAQQSTAPALALRLAFASELGLVRDRDTGRPSPGHWQLEI